MKRIFFSIVIALICFTPIVYGQDTPPAVPADEERLKPIDGNWGFTFNLTGLINNLQLEGSEDMLGHEIIFVRKYLKDDLALRIGFGYNTVRTTTTQKDSLNIALVEFDSTFRKSDFYLSGGVEKHLGKMRRLDPYVGGQFAFQLIGGEKYTWNRNSTDPTGTTKTEGEYKLDGGVGIGIHGILGFNYFIVKNIALGAEYRFGYNYLKQGGAFSESIRTTPPTGNATTSYSQGTNELKASGFEMNSTANVMLSIFF